MKDEQALRPAVPVAVRTRAAERAAIASRVMKRLGKWDAVDGVTPVGSARLHVVLAAKLTKARTPVAKLKGTR